MFVELFAGGVDDDRGFDGLIGGRSPGSVQGEVPVNVAVGPVVDVLEERKPYNKLTFSRVFEDS